MIQLNKILKSFQRTLDQLEQLISANQREVDTNSQHIDKLQEKNLVLLLLTPKFRRNPIAHH